MAQPNPAEQPADQNLAFSVDTHLLRELGALLVGRDSTAVVELIKNAYDADATRVVLHAEELTSHGLITVSDDGHGMTVADFTDKFLRIAGRSKEGGERKSPLFHRRYTGAKGIGRLSAHKLGRSLSLESNPDLSLPDRSAEDLGFRATINWEAIEKSTESIEQAKEISLVEMPARPASATVLTIGHLFSPWRGAQLRSFLHEVRSTRPDETLISPPSTRAFPGDSLLGQIDVADTSSNDPGFAVELSGDFAGSDPQWPSLLAYANWMIEIDGRSAHEVRYRITPGRDTREANPHAEVRDFSYARSSRGPLFVARVFARDGSAGKKRTLPDILKRFSDEAAGIRLFMEGFRVLPYGTPRNDWLGLDADYSRRASLEVTDDGIGSDARDERTFLLPNANYFGGVYLHDAQSNGLEMVVNREGFLPGEALTDLIENVRRGMQLSVRYRAAIGESARQDDLTKKAEEREREIASLLETTPYLEDSTGQSRDSTRLNRWLAAGTEAAAALRADDAKADPQAFSQHVKIVSTAMEELRAANDLVKDEQAQLRVLASLGTQIGAFVHEVNGVLGQARIVTALLDKLLSDDTLTTSVARSVRATRDASKEVVASLERQAVYLSDSFGAETGRRRSRQIVSDRVATAMRLLTASAQSRHVNIADQTPKTLKTLPMFPAEMNVILTNILSNAIKAASAPGTGGEFGSVDIAGRSSADSTQLVISNTGVAVAEVDAERWFRPFETTTSDVDMVLGQGLGLGLPLTRRIVEEYGGTVRFITPQQGYATAVEIVLPNR
ncbi:ATP-binding protein [Microbacterium sp. NPDC090281]|uniref:ATP-binding protein n=1 Tax=Microbacterium sp. NPDC090281 TaxID=3364208 RepID=UPI0037F2B197